MRKNKNKDGNKSKKERGDNSHRFSVLVVKQKPINVRKSIIPRKTSVESPSTPKNEG